MDRRQFLHKSAAAAAATSMSGVLGQSAATAARPALTHKTRFAVNLEMWFTDRPFLDRIDRAADLGFPGIEFWEYEEKDIDAIADRAAARSLEIAQFTGWGFSPGMNHPDNEEAFLAGIKAACEVAHRLRCTKMTVVAGDDQPGMTKAQMHDQVIRALRRAAPVAERAGVMMILEPMNGRVDHPGHCLYGSADAMRICRAVNSEAVKINWDMYHMQIEEGDLTGHLREGMEANLVGYLQLADHPGRNEPGTGEIHYNRVLRAAHELGYRDYVGLECRPVGDDEAAARAVAAADVW